MANLNSKAWLALAVLAAVMGLLIFGAAATVVVCLDRLHRPDRCSAH